MSKNHSKIKHKQSTPAKKLSNTHTSNSSHTSASCHHHTPPTNPKELAKNLSKDEEIIYTCPMHLEIRQAGPGSCPICGMALEPEVVSIDQGENPELKDFRKRLLVAVLMSIPLLILEMLVLISNFSPSAVSLIIKFFPTELSMRITMFILASPIILYSAQPFFYRGWMSVVNRNLNMFSLISLGVGIAYIYSIIVTFANLEHLYVYFGTAGFIVMLTLLGQVIELKAREKTSDAIKSLLELNPVEALRINKDGSEETIAIDLVEVGDRLKIKAYDKIPVDGKIVLGSSYVDQSAFSGESKPRKVGLTDTVYASSANLAGNFEMIAKQVGKGTLLSQIIQQVSAAQRSKSPSQKLADKVSSYFVPVVIAISVITFIFWFFAIDFEFALVNSIAVLIVACPCALGLATPISISQGMGLAAKNGILIKNAVILEGLSKIKKIVLDKTGTLTEGKITIIDIQLEKGITKKEALAITYALEASSVHPIAEAFIFVAKKHKVSKSTKIGKTETALGSGIISSYNKKKVHLGGNKLMKTASISIPKKYLNSDVSQIFLAIDNKVMAVFSLKDQIKQNAKQVIADLADNQIETIVLSGDTAKTTSRVAKELAITDFIADVLPTDKGRYIKEFKKDGSKVAMVGDGVNDAPALARADVGIAMSSGSRVAVENSDVTLLAGDLSKLLAALKLSRIVRYNIVENLFFAFIYNGLGIPIAAGLFYFSLNLTLSPVIAALAMASSSICVILNALRIGTKKLV